MRQVVIVHGWSDTSRSFRPLAGFLQDHGYQPVPLWLGDYISLDDDVSVPDVAQRMDRVVRDRIASGELAPEFDLIVHSTGGLVVREWISACYGGAIGQCPAKRLVMLAPANFGSRLASLGQSMLGRLVKGWNNWFHTGKRMLDALELSSPYQWELVQRDLFVPPNVQSAPALYGADGVWPFVIVGSHPYPGALRQIVNENGSDGTVRVPAANLNTRGVTIDFSVDEAEPRLTPWRLRQPDPFPFAVLPDRTHASIINPDKPDVGADAATQARLGELILQALACDSRNTYQAMVDEWNAVSEQTAALTDHAQRSRVFTGDQSAELFHQFLQINVRVTDNHGQDVGDYFLEFSGPEQERGSDSTVYFHRHVLENVHVNEANKALRCLYVDRTDLVENYYDHIRGQVAKVLEMSVSANPVGANVSYFSDYRAGAKGTLTVHRQDADTPGSRWLKRNTTHFVHIVIPRTPSDKVFRLSRYQ